MLTLHLCSYDPCLKFANAYLNENNCSDSKRDGNTFEENLKLTVPPPNQERDSKANCIQEIVEEEPEFTVSVSKYFCLGIN